LHTAARHPATPRFAGKDFSAFELSLPLRYTEAVILKSQVSGQPPMLNLIAFAD
jgi:hypothetical protein